MPEKAYIVYKVSKPAPGPEIITYFDHGSTQLSMEFMLFINVKKCWHLDSILKIREFFPCKQENICVQVNILVFTGS